MPYGDRVSAPGNTEAGPTGVCFVLPDPGATGVRLELDFDPGIDPEFTLVGDRWVLELPRPAVDRLEYQFTVRRGEHTDWVTDPGNPRRVANPFGDKSEIVFPGYRSPGWLGTEPTGTLTDLTAAAEGDVPAVPATLWSPAGLADTTPAMLLLVHDGTDMAERGSLLRWATRRSRVQPVRLLLLDPVSGLRDDWYAANQEYAVSLAPVVERVRDLVVVSDIVGLGASLGAVGMMTLHRAVPGLLSGLALQSGSFFTRTLDPQESGYRLFDRLCAATEAVTATPPPPIPTLITVGSVEENRDNNEALARTLVAAGWEIRVSIFRDAHTMTGWRDAWFPDLDHLLDLVHRTREDTP